MSANTNRLNQPFPALGSARTYFFNGRLLAAEDLSREQTLRETGQKQLARIIGCGIERGLNVQGQVGNSLLQITGGLGIAPSGWSQVGNGALRILTDPAASGLQRFYRLRQ